MWVADTNIHPQASCHSSLTKCIITSTPPLLSLWLTHMHSLSLTHTCTPYHSHTCTLNPNPSGHHLRCARPPSPTHSPPSHSHPHSPYHTHPHHTHTLPSPSQEDESEPMFSAPSRHRMTPHMSNIAEVCVWGGGGGR